MTLAAEHPTARVTSRYNFHVPVDGGVLLYNANTGAILRFNGRDARDLAASLTGGRIEVLESRIPPEVYRQLRVGGFIVDANFDELAQIRDRFWHARSETPMALTITTTMDCNLGCYYCYEERSGDKLEVKDVSAITALARKRLSTLDKRSLHVDWYGGEPLLNREFMEAASEALQVMCAEENVAYSASIISNGTCWPEDVTGFLTRNRIRQVQISFDGMRESHNRRRHYRKGYVPDEGASSFDRAAEVVDALLDHVRVDVRLNIDYGNQADVRPFIEFARSRGWFERRFPVVIQPARLSSYSDHSSFMRKSELSLEEYDAVRALVREEVRGEAPVEEAEISGGYPHPKTSVCAALANDSVVIGADRRQYRCGLQVGESQRAVGMLAEPPKRQLPVLNQSSTGSDETWWQQFDPTTLPTCSRCSFLPICWGGCPKKHLEKDAHAIAEQGAYWRQNLPRLITMGAGSQVINSFSFGEADQFR
jgi:uncharacterized protein